MAQARCDVAWKGDRFDYLEKQGGIRRDCGDGVKVVGRDYVFGHKRVTVKDDSHKKGGFNGVLFDGGKYDDAVAYGVRLGIVDPSDEKGEQMRRDKKRKFSPIIWDRKEGARVKISSASKFVTSKFPIESSRTCSDADVAVYPVAANQLQGSESPSAESCISHGSVERLLSECRVDLSPLVTRESYFNKKQELDSNDGFEKGYNILRSRWASDDDSLGSLHLPGGVASSERQERGHDHVFSSPECGEYLRDGSAGYEGSGSDEGSCPSGSAHRDECFEDVSDCTDAMDIEEAHDGGCAVGQLGYDSYDDTQKVQDSPVSVRGRVNMLQCCRSVFEYERLNKINEGAYGVVYRARDKETGEIMALKKVKMGREAEREGFPLTALREINILLSFDHPSVVGVKEVVADEGDGIFMVMEYMEHDLKGLMERMKQPFNTSEVKCLMKQLLEGVKYLHDNWVIHRDLKTSNILLNNRGEMKICDFGLSRQYGSPSKPYTSLVVTLWYRAPELLLGQKQYTTAIDMWSVGCIMAELLAKKPLFQGETEIDQLGKIFRILGSPNEEIWPGFNKLPGSRGNFVKQPYNSLRKIFPVSSFTGSQVLSDSGYDLLNKLLTFNPDKRITAEEALNHDWFREIPLAKSKDFMPTFPAQHCQGRYLDQITRKYR